MILLSREIDIFSVFQYNFKTNPASFYILKGYFTYIHWFFHGDAAVPKERTVNKLILKK